MNLSKETIANIRLIIHQTFGTNYTAKLGMYAMSSDCPDAEDIGCYYNRLEPFDKEYGDLYDTCKWAELKYVNVRLIDNKAMLCFYIYGPDKDIDSNCFVLIESIGSEQKIIEAYKDFHGNSIDLKELFKYSPIVRRQYNMDKNFDKKSAESYLNKLLKKYKISVYAWSTTSCGRAYIKEKRIKIPKPTNTDRFAVCLHEVGHIHNGKVRPRYKSEYLAEQYALQHLELSGCDTEKYVQRARNYVLYMLAKAHNRGLDWSKVPKEIIDFTQTDVSAWVGHKVFISGVGLNTVPEIVFRQKASVGNEPSLTMSASTL